LFGVVENRVYFYERILTTAQIGLWKRMGPSPRPIAKLGITDLPQSEGLVRIAPIYQPMNNELPKKKTMRKCSALKLL
jgi:hypothetical protein